MTNISVKICEYCGDEYTIECTCVSERKVNSVKKSCMTCLFNYEGECSSNEFHSEIIEFLKKNKYESLEKIGFVQMEPNYSCGNYMMSDEHINTLNINNRFKRCYTCEFYHGDSKCVNDKNINLILKNAQKFGLPISILPCIDTYYSHSCVRHKFKKCFIKKILNNGF